MTDNDIPTPMGNDDDAPRGPLDTDARSEPERPEIAGHDGPPSPEEMPSEPTNAVPETGRPPISETSSESIVGLSAEDTTGNAVQSEATSTLPSPELVRADAGRAMREGRFSEAADTLSELVRKHRDDGEAWRLLGGALSSLGDTDAAVVAFTEALRCAPGEARSHYNLALALERAGRIDAAKDRYGACLAIDPTHAGALERRALLGTRGASEAAASPAEGRTPSEPEPFSLNSAPATPEPSPRRLQPPVPPSRTEFPQSGPQAQRSSRWGETPDSSSMDGGPGGRQRPLQPRPTSAAEAELQSSTIFALAIVGLAGGLTCGLPLLVSPVAWMMANQSLERMKRMDEVDPTVKNQLRAGRTMGILGTSLLAMFIVLLMLLIVLGIAA